MDNNIEVAVFFPSLVFVAQDKSFLDIVREVSTENIILENDLVSADQIYPVIYSNNYANNQKLNDFSSFIGNTSWNILNDQGYDMVNKRVFIDQMWTQEHYKYSNMEQHIHGQNAQLVGFYFIAVPENSPFLLFHDPRPGKTQIDLPEKNQSELTNASRVANIKPQEGMFVFSNAWLPHSFTRNPSEDPFKLVHFIVSVKDIGQQAEVI